jgi:hypothetical protein
MKRVWSRRDAKRWVKGQVIYACQSLYALMCCVILMATSIDH